MRPLRLFLSVLVTISWSTQEASCNGFGGGGYSYNAPSGYSYPRPSNPLLLPGENEIEIPRQGKVIFGTAEDNVNSDLILDRGSGRTRVIEEEVIVQERPRAPARERVVVEEQVVERAPPPRRQQERVVEEVVYDDDSREAALNRGGTREENIQDVRDGVVNNEVVREEVVEERRTFSDSGSSGGSTSGVTEERFVDDGEGETFTEEGSSSRLNSRRTNVRGSSKRERDDRRRPSSSNDRRTSSSSKTSRYSSSSNIRPRVQTTTRRPFKIQKTTTRESTRASGSSNREIANKAYGVGRKNDESISGSSTRSRLLEQSFRKDLKAPNYNTVPDDENFNVRSNSDRDINNFRTSSSTTTIRKSSVNSSPRKSYSSLDEDDDDFRNTIVRKTTSRPAPEDILPESVENEKAIESSQLIEGGSFAASNNDQVVSKGGSSTGTSTYRSAASSSTSPGRKSYGGLDDDSDGSGSSNSFSSISSLLASFERKRRDPYYSDALTSASDSFAFRTSGTGFNVDTSKYPPHYQQLMTGTPAEVADLTKSTYMYTRTAPICPNGGCLPAASSRGDFLDYKPSGSSSFPRFKAPNHFEHL